MRIALNIFPYDVCAFVCRCVIVDEYLDGEIGFLHHEAIKTLPDKILVILDEAVDAQQSLRAMGGVMGLHDDWRCAVILTSLLLIGYIYPEGLRRHILPR